MELVADSFMVTLTSGTLLPVTAAAAPRSGVPTVLPFGLCAEDGGGFSTIEWVEFCLALDDAGLPPFVGGGDGFPVTLDSGNVVRMGEEAKDGDIAAELTVLFLFGL